MTQLYEIERMIQTRLDQAKIDIIEAIRALEQNEDMSLKEALETYADKKGISLATAKDEFVATFNRKHKTNIRRLITGYRYKHFIQNDIDVLEYLETVDRASEGIDVIKDMNSILWS